MDIQNIHTLFLNSSGITTDSRGDLTGKLFLALIGERFDGNDFAEKALANGAKGAIISNKALREHTKCIYVKDTLACLQNLATYHRNFCKTPIIAITGTNGKTTTKELLNSVLSQHFRTFSTKGNFNNHIGVPLSLLSITPETELAIIEMGANHIGDIHELCEIAEPNYGLITNIGIAHLEGFGSVEGIKKTKTELFRFLEKNNGTIFINRNEPSLNEFPATSYPSDELVEYGKPTESNFKLKLIEITPTLSLQLETKTGKKHPIKTQLAGKYNLNNIWTALALGDYFKVPLKKIIKGIEEYTPSNNRSQMVRIGSNQILLDAYNANPTSMMAALENFTHFPSPKIAILGDMLELGATSEEEHQALINQITTKLKIEAILIGPEFQKTTKNSNIRSYENINQLKAIFNWSKYQNTHFLIKGSRGIKLESLLENHL